MIARIAGRQHGRVARRQLLAAGIGRRAIERRVESGRLRAVHPGVYAVGHEAPSAHALWSAVVLAAGPGAVLSHLSAAALWGLIEITRGVVHVTVPRKRKGQPGLWIHRAEPPADEVTVRDGIPVTTVARTLLDLAALLPHSQLQRAVRQAEFLRLIDSADLARILDRHPRSRGRAKLAAIVEQARGSRGYSRSHLEDLFLDFLDEAGLPAPLTNARLTVRGETFEVDCYWPDAGLVWLDGAAAHQASSSFEEDRRRDRALTLAGLTTLRITWHSLQRERAALRRELTALLVRTDGRSLIT